jgi:hypothetical protein
VDLIFTEPHAVLPAWQVTAATLPGIDDHFWDWMLWLAAKQQAGKPAWSPPNSPSCMSICWPRSASGHSRPHPRRPSEVTGPPAAARNTG